MIGPRYYIDAESTVVKHPFYNKSNAEIIRDLDMTAYAQYSNDYAPDSEYYNMTSKYAGYAFDALVMAILALDSYSKAFKANALYDKGRDPIFDVTIKQFDYDYNNAPAEPTNATYAGLLGIFRSLVPFTGITGEVRFNSKNDRESDMYVYQFDGYVPEDGSGTISLLRGVVKLMSDVYTPLSDWRWYTSDNSKPVTYSVTAYRWRTWGGYTAGGIAFAIIAPLSTKLAILPFLKYRKLKLALANRWCRPTRLLTKIRTLDDPGVHVFTRATHHCDGLDVIDASLHSNHGAYRLKLRDISSKFSRFRRHRNFPKDDNEDEKIVIIVNVSRSLRGATNVTKQLTREMVLKSKTLFYELIAMQSMVGKHNVTQFYGCVFTKEIVGTCYEWQPNGTLQELVRRAPFDLDLELTLSLIADVVRGKWALPKLVYACCGERLFILEKLLHALPIPLNRNSTFWSPNFA